MRKFNSFLQSKLIVYTKHVSKMSSSVVLKKMFLICRKFLLTFLKYGEKPVKALSAEFIFGIFVSPNYDSRCTLKKERNASEKTINWKKKTIIQETFVMIRVLK